MKSLLLCISILFLLACQDSDSSNDGTSSGNHTQTDSSSVISSDLDSDGIDDSIDPDIDGDNIPNADDFYPENSLRWNDVDTSNQFYRASCDCIALPVDSDNDGYLDEDDAFPNDASEWSDLDGDLIGDNSDEDLDGDGVNNDLDQFPYDKLEAFDSDGDMIPNNQDDDDDNDLHLDINDAFPLDPNEYLDTDSDGIGNNADEDIDGDGLLNDAHIEDSSAALAMGLDNNDDGVALLNHADQMPKDPNEYLDSDLDGIGNNEDLDDDNDGYLDYEDKYSIDPNEWADRDQDNIGDNEDLDDDNDGVNDVVDPDPYDPDVPSLRTNECATPDVTLKDINSVTDFINAMPMPLTLPCFVQALPRPLAVNATSGATSVQPALGAQNPRVFIFYNEKLYLSVVMNVDASDPKPILELSELTGAAMSIKAELIFPITEPINYGSAFDHIRNASGTVCGTCHSNEKYVDTRNGIAVYESEAFKTFPNLDVRINDMRDERNLCDSAIEPYRCEMYRAMFDHGTVFRHNFSTDFLLFQ